MPPSARPNPPATAQSAREYPRSPGRVMTSSSTVANVTRSATTPSAPTRGNNSAAKADPNCTDTAPASTSPTPPRVPRPAE